MRIALSSYRSKPHSGGQGVYVRNLSRELVALGHDVEVFSGQPYPELDPGVRLTPVPSLDLYRDDDPFRTPSLREYRDWIDVQEFAIMCTAGFPEPLTFSRRLARLMRARAGDFDVLHDNQTLGWGILAIQRQGLPVVTTIHHPISRDRAVDLAQATGSRRLSLRRWYGFVRMQRAVARRLRHLVTVSQQSARDIEADFGVPAARARVIPVGVDVDVFRPGPAKVPGRLVAVTSSPSPLKGLEVLLEAFARLCPGADGDRDAHLVVVGTPSETARKVLASTGVAERVRFRTGLPQAELAALLASAQALVVPSRYEGFSLPAVEAMASGTPVVGTTVGALPDLVGDHGERGRLVAPGDPVELAAALADVLADPAGALLAGVAARRHAVAAYSWSAVAAATATVYEEALRAAGRTATEPVARPVPTRPARVDVDVPPPLTLAAPGAPGSPPPARASEETPVA